MIYNNTTIIESIQKKINDKTLLDCKPMSFGQSTDPRSFGSNIIGNGKFKITINEQKLKETIKEITGKDSKVELNDGVLTIDYVEMDTEKR